MKNYVYYWYYHMMEKEEQQEITQAIRIKTILLLLNCIKSIQ